MKKTNYKKKEVIRCANGHLLQIDDQQLAMLEELADSESTDVLTKDND